MATIRSELKTRAPASEVWSAIRDICALHTRLVPGFVVDTKLEPGARIPSERDLGERFGVSRTVVREAIRHLAAKGVLEARSGHGVRVADLQHEGVAETIELFRQAAK